MFSANIFCLSVLHCDDLWLITINLNSTTDAVTGPSGGEEREIKIIVQVCDVQLVRVMSSWEEASIARSGSELGEKNASEQGGRRSCLYCILVAFLAQ